MTELTSQQLKCLCSKADLLFVIHDSMSTLLSEHAEKLTNEYHTNPKYRTTSMPSIANVKQEGNPQPIPQFDLSNFLDPVRSDKAFQFLADSIASVRITLGPALTFYSRQNQTFDMPGYSRLPLDETPNINFDEMFAQIVLYSKTCNNIRKILLSN